MKKILAALALVLFPIVSLAESNKNDSELSLEQCEEILGAGMFNGVLEDVCGFNGGVKENLKKIYDQGQCGYKVPQSTVDFLAKDVLEDSRMRYKAFGEKAFCDGNLKGYTDLMD